MLKLRPPIASQPTFWKLDILPKKNNKNEFYRDNNPAFTKSYGHVLPLAITYYKETKPASLQFR